jgi:hypothetical protein
VPAVQDYVPLGKLEVGTALHVQGGGEAILVSKTWRQGDFEVFDFEVEGLHNFYVRGPGSDAAGDLVHNSKKPDFVYRGGSDTPGNLTPRPGKDTDGLSTFTTPEKAARPGGKVQKIDTSKLDNVCVGECSPSGHVSLSAGSTEATAEWAATRGSATVHPLTQEVQGAIVETIKLPK